jgi:hypothetical protein
MSVDGTRQATKTEAGNRIVPLVPALRRLLVQWQLARPALGRTTSSSAPQKDARFKSGT